MRPALDQFKGQHWGNYCSVHRQGCGGVGGGINRLLEWPGTVLDWSGLNCWQGQGLWYGLAGIVIWSGRKERSESVLAGHPRYATCAERKLMYICIYNLYKDKTMSWEQLSPKKQVSHFGLCHGMHEYLTMIFYTKTYSNHMTPFKPKCSLWWYKLCNRLKISNIKISEDTVSQFHWMSANNEPKEGNLSIILYPKVLTHTAIRTDLGKNNSSLPGPFKSTVCHRGAFWLMTQVWNQICSSQVLV